MRIPADADGPDVTSGWSASDLFRIFRRSRRVHHRFRAPLMYSNLPKVPKTPPSENRDSLKKHGLTEDEIKCVFSRSQKKTSNAHFWCNKKIPVPVLSSKGAMRSPFCALVFYVHETVQGVTRTPLFSADPGSPKNGQFPPPRKP